MLVGARFLNHDGLVSMDAGFADGCNRTYGGVANVAKIKNPVKLARMVAKYKEHNLISGKDAINFAKENSLEIRPDEYFLTEYRHQQWIKANKEDRFLPRSFRCRFE